MPSSSDVADQVAKWALPALATLAFTVSGWFFNRLDTSLDRLNTSVGQLNRKVDVLEDAREQNRGLRDRLSRVEAKVEAHQIDGHGVRGGK